MPFVRLVDLARNGAVAVAVAMALGAAASGPAQAGRQPETPPTGALFRSPAHAGAVAGDRGRHPRHAPLHRRLARQAVPGGVARTARNGHRAQPLARDGSTVRRGAASRQRSRGDPSAHRRSGADSPYRGEHPGARLQQLPPRGGLPAAGRDAELRAPPERGGLHPAAPRERHPQAADAGAPSDRRLHRSAAEHRERRVRRLVGHDRRRRLGARARRRRPGTTPRSSTSRRAGCSTSPT